MRSELTALALIAKGTIRLKHLMPKTKRKGKVRGPQKALAFEEVPALMVDLREVDTVAGRIAGGLHPDL